MNAALSPDPTRSAPMIGVIGLGAMGAGIAESLLRAGFEVHVLSGRATAQIERLSTLGSVVAHDRLIDLLDHGGHVLTCLPAGSDVLAMAEELPVDDGRARALIDCSTIGVGSAAAVWRATRAAGWQYIDAPLTGGPKRAASGELICYFSADGTPRAGVLEAVDAFCAKIVQLGEPGSGQSIKLANNSVLLGLVALNGYALLLADSAGVGAEEFVEIVRGGAADNWQLQNYLPGALAADAEVGFALQLAHKDLALVIDAAESQGLDLGVLKALDALYQKATLQEQAEGQRADFSNVICELRSPSPPTFEE